MIMENALLKSNDEHQEKKKKSQEGEVLSEWLPVKDVKKLLNEEWDRSDTIEMLKTVTPQRVVRRGRSMQLSLDCMFNFFVKFMGVFFVLFFAITLFWSVASLCFCLQ